MESLFNKVSILKARNLIKKKTPLEVFSCECRESFKSSFFIEHLWWLLLRQVHLHHNHRQMIAIISPKSPDTSKLELFAILLAIMAKNSIIDVCVPYFH